MGTLIFSILMIISGCISIAFGWLIWRKQKINWINECNWRNVKEENKKHYTEKIGKSIMIFGIGFYFAGVIMYKPYSVYGLIGFIICFAIGLIMLIKAQYKYNNGIL